MIVIPRLLIDQLRLVEGPVQRELALSFGEHVVEVCEGAFDDTEPLRTYLKTARGFLAGTQTIADVDAERLKFSQWHAGLDRSLADIAWTVHLAVLACAGNELTQHIAETYWKYQRPPSSKTSVIDVARNAQRVVGRWVAGSRDDPKAAGRAQWEEARWQLIRTIEAAPNPHTRDLA